MSPMSLEPIVAGAPIVEPDGDITEFFRLRWQALIDSFQITPTAAAVQLLNQSASIATVAAFTTKKAGFYRLTAYVEKTVADGTNSAVTLTWGWTTGGLPLTKAEAPLNTDTVGANESYRKEFWADANVDLTYQITYASNTPGAMKYRADIAVEALA